jgi:hypothetical protein
MEFSNDNSEFKEKDSSTDFLTEYGNSIRVESDMSTAKESIGITKRKPVEISCKHLISILSAKDSFPPLAAAFDKRHVNVVWVDLSHGQYRYLLSSSSGKMDISKPFSERFKKQFKGFIFYMFQV